MRQVMVGMLIGSIFTGGLSLAGNLYDSKGNVQAARGSTQQYDYFRQRRQQLDIQHMRKAALLRGEPSAQAHK